MEITPQIFRAKVMHKRLFPRINQFTYRVYYVALPLPAGPLPSRLLSFQLKDHGARDGNCLDDWARKLLLEHGMKFPIAAITLVTMPRVLGYAFNPVSFFFCLDEAGGLRAVICEVHNTFGEQHSYLCMHSDCRPIHSEDLTMAPKRFHVSPFLPREGSYRFRFSLSGKQLGIWIDYYDAQQQKQLITSLTGKLEPLTAASLRRAFWSHPLVTLKTIGLIHWQALKLFAKAIRYVPKPPPLPENSTSTSNLTKM